ncbi:hypothetical protein [Burkholderia sp. LMG 21824]
MESGRVVERPASGSGFNRAAGIGAVSARLNPPPEAVTQTPL